MIRLEQRGAVAFTCMGIAVLVICSNVSTCPQCTGRLRVRGALGTSESAEPTPSFHRNAPAQAFRSSLARPSRNATSAFSPASLAAGSVLKSVP